jgi:hypothetical protein
VSSLKQRGERERPGNFSRAKGGGRDKDSCGLAKLGKRVTGCGSRSGAARLGLASSFPPQIKVLCIYVLQTICTDQRPRIFHI